jgi:hypothetical protein
LEEEKSLSELNKANASIIINNSENNNEIVYNQNPINSFSKSSPNLNIGNLNSILDNDNNNSSIGTINHNNSNGFFQIVHLV